MKRKSIIILALVLAFTLGNTKCSGPTSSTIDKAAGASRELAHDTVAGENAVKTLYQAGKLSDERKNWFADKFKFIAEQGTKFNDLVVRLDAQEKAGTLPANYAQLIADNFLPISQAFSDLLTEIQKLPSADAKQLTDATHGLKQDVNTIKGLK